MNAAFRHVICMVTKIQTQKVSSQFKLYTYTMIKNKNLQDSYENGLQK